MKDGFRKFSHGIAYAVGRPATFVVALAAVLVWAASGPIFHFSDTWQLVINTSTTIITFLMVFVIQNTQNRDGEAMQLKLDELIRANEHARNGLVGLEFRSDEELERLESQFERLHKQVRRVRRKRDGPHAKRGRVQAG
jgi:low affinity Fe/Cu permease